MPEKKKSSKRSDGRGWYFESVRHSLASKGVKTGEQEPKPAKKPLIGRYAKPYEQTKSKKTFSEMVEDDPKKRWLWGVKLKPKDKVKLMTESIVAGPAAVEPSSEETKKMTPEEHKLRIEFAQAKDEKEQQPQVSPQVQKPSGINPQSLQEEALPPPPPESMMKQKSKSSKAKFPNVESAWEAAQDELSARYGDEGSSSSGVVKDDDEAEQRLSKNMGVR